MLSIGELELGESVLGKSVLGELVLGKMLLSQYLQGDYGLMCDTFEVSKKPNVWYLLFKFCPPPLELQGNIFLRFKQRVPFLMFLVDLTFTISKGCKPILDVSSRLDIHH